MSKVGLPQVTRCPIPLRSDLLVSVPRSLGQIPHLHRTAFLRGSLDLELKVSTLIGNGDQDRLPGAPKALPPIWVFALTRSWNVRSGGLLARCKSQEPKLYLEP